MFDTKEKVLLIAQGSNSEDAINKILNKEHDKFSECLVYTETKQPESNYENNDKRSNVFQELINQRVSFTSKPIDLESFVSENKIESVYISLGLDQADQLNHWVTELNNTTTTIKFIPDLSKVNLASSQVDASTELPVISIRENPFKGFKGLIKRFIDILFSLTIISLLSPLLLFVALGIKLTSPGPIIFRQKRHGFNGQEFDVYKFRTMSVCENGNNVTQATKNDPRVTKIGAILRKTSIDELPQFFNVLEGTMSVVGPRPHPVNLNYRFKTEIDGFWSRHIGVPGITGLAQVNKCRGETATVEDMEKRVHYDLEYIKHWNILLDIKIMFLTAYQLTASIFKINTIQEVY
ncbi:MAG: exopolysaccharide biosynthesis polyprenyl glycosylphosphotransferase [Candidatus Caenarcaniphilales bacterium]|nr:exopolysaccharide biosynthesis polyprenyl glycosylphosphotransferase [Candidatus Caenarcaniphilales bacterium]